MIVCFVRPAGWRQGKFQQNLGEVSERESLGVRNGWSLGGRLVLMLDDEVNPKINWGGARVNPSAVSSKAGTAADGAT